MPDGRRQQVFVRGVWRDYARQFGAVVLDARDWQRLAGDRRINDLALWLEPGTARQVRRGRLRLRSDMYRRVTERSGTAETRPT